MKINIIVNIRVGAEQVVKVEEGTRKVRAVYETDRYTVIGYIRKAAAPSGRTIGWAAYTKTGRQVGIYTLREFAFIHIIQAAIVQ